MMRKQELIVREFLQDSDVPKYLFGTNPKAEQIIQALPFKVNGVIDEVTQMTVFCGIPVVKSLDNIEKNAIVVSCIHSCYPLTIQNKISSHGLKSVDLFSFMKYSGIKVDIESWVGFNESYKQHKSEYIKIFSMLADNESKDIWKRIIKFRLNMDFSQMAIFSVRTDRQYFEPFLNLKPQGEVFVDVGGYDGFSSAQFIKYCPKYDSILFLEPESNILKRAKDVLKGERVSFYQLAVSNKRQKLHFASNAAASRISELGNIEVDADTIDNVIGNRRVTYLKMDIEGSEADAIAGAVKTIQKDHPRLAICVYHKPADFIDLPQQILAIRDDYDLYLRHYTEGTAETVMYFVPS